MRKSIITKKTLPFSVKVVKASNYLKDNKHEYDMSRQLLRSATSIGVNVVEALNGVSKKDFINKISISLKEANETYYWITLLSQTDYKNELIDNLIHPCKEIIKF